MRQLSPAGQRAVNDLAHKHGFSPEAVALMLDAVMNGHGGMAQFSHPEFGGYGQWMRGGMTMIGDMFNSGLKARVEALCGDLAAAITEGTGLTAPDRSPSRAPRDEDRPPRGHGPERLFTPARDESGMWWPKALGQPDSTGAQNDIRYAYFAGPRRLAIERNGTLTVHDTLDHQISGVSQQQSSRVSLSFSSQHGPVDVETLPVVQGQEARAATAPEKSMVSSPEGGGADIPGLIEKLADLHAKGVLTEAEFTAKKAALLARL